MKNLVDLLKTHAWKVSTFLFLFLFLAKGCTNNKLSSLDKNNKESVQRLEQKIDSLQVAVSRLSTTKQVRDEMERTMFDYLIYEDDLDKGKSSLSDVKNKIEAND